MPRSVFLVTLGALVPCVIWGCANPRIFVDSRPEHAFVHRDGRPLGTTPLHFAMPYHGRILVEIEMDDEKWMESGRFHRPARRVVEVPAPFSPWFFPLDFAGESFVRLLGLEDRRINVTLEEVPIASLDPAILIREVREAAVAR